MPDKVNISQPVTSIGGEQFIQFEMSPSADGDDVYLYEQLVEPVLQSGDSPSHALRGKDMTTHPLLYAHHLSPPA